MKTELENLKAQGKAPDWMTENGFTTLKGGYLLEGETPRDMYLRVAESISSYLNKNEGIKQRFFNYMWDNWLCPSTPILSNSGTNRGLPISCYTIDVDDSIDSIYTKVHELAMLSKHGGGVGINVSSIRSRGSLIQGGVNGKTEGKIPFIKSFEQTTMAVSQGSTRRGASAVYDSIYSGDFEDFVNLRRADGDPLTRAQNIHHGIVIDDEFMKEVKNRNENALNKWRTIIKNRVETGEPYLFFKDNVNNQNPECYKINNLIVNASNICLTGDTIIAVADGRNGISIKQLALESNGKIKFPVYSANYTDSWKTEIKNAIAFKTGEYDVIEISLENGDKFRCTSNHKLALINGTYLEAKFCLNETLEQLNGNGLRVIKIELKEKEEVFDLTVEDNHNFYILTNKTKDNGVLVHNCTEITGYTDFLHSFVCCVYSINLAMYNVWKGNVQFIKDVVAFGDGVISEFIHKAKNLSGFANAVRFAEKSRMLGIGVLGFHSLLQQNGLPFESLQTKLLNQSIFKFIRENADLATRELAELYGEPEWCKGFNRRNTHTLAIAPTVSNSKISGDRSPSIEPWEFNDLAEQGAKGTSFFRNPILLDLLRKYNKDTVEVWNSIRKNSGSVQHLDFLSKEQKELFLTAKEINQFILVIYAADRQKYIDQAQSLNLFFKAGSTPKYISDVHIDAWERGLKTLYYLRTENAFKSSSAERYERSKNECSWCEG